MAKLAGTHISAQPRTELPSQVPSELPPDGRRSLVQSRYGALNGLRGVALLMVFVNHFGPFVVPETYVVQLWTGVSLFFVLSGFLITGILVDAKGSKRYFRDFYIRRSLRIFPLYYGFFILAGVCILLFHLKHDPYFWWYFPYVANFAMIHPTQHNPTVFLVFGHPIALGALWTLCVEEQFYLIWPLLIWLLPTRRAAMRFSAGAIALTVIVRVSVYLHDPTAVAETHFLYWMTYAHCDALFLGAWMALWLREAKLTLTDTRRISWSLIVGGMTILLCGYFLFGRRWPNNEVNPLLCTYGYTVIDLVAFGFLLLAIDNRTQLNRWLRNEQLANLGIISYGFYFFHAMLLSNLRAFNSLYVQRYHLSVVFVILIFAGVYGLAKFSYRYYEAPFLQLKDRWAPSHRGVPSGKL